jgi:hypothetical protein
MSGDFSMNREHRRKPKVSTTYAMPDGSTGTRSLMEDFETLRGRIFTRVRLTIGSEAGNKFVLPAINAYNTADYEAALAHFMESANRYPVISEEIRPHLLICERVLTAIPTPEDVQYRESFARWERLPKLFKIFVRTPVFKIRCKYCGHYTLYIHPEEGFAYFGTNNCQICDRGYPAPDFAWDGVDGQAYIYYRHSVTEPEFYKEFEREYDVNPDHTFFLRKDKPNLTNK